jgi:hypothetical protein
VSKRLDNPYRPGPQRSWVKVKNPLHPAMYRVKDGPLARDGLPDDSSRDPHAVIMPTPEERKNRAIVSSCQPKREREGAASRGLLDSGRYQRPPPTPTLTPTPGPTPTPTRGPSS